MRVGVREFCGQRKAQLANEEPRADLLIAWEWESCLSPLHSNSTAALYKQYKQYVLGENGW